MNAVKALFLTVIGFILGVFLVVVFLGSVLTGYAAVSVGKMLKGNEVRGISVYSNTEIGTPEEEMSRALAEIKLNQGVTLDEKTLGRLAAASLKKSSGDGVFFDSLFLDIEENRLMGELYFTIESVLMDNPYKPVRNISTSMDFDLKMVQLGENILLKIQDLKVGEYRVPLPLIRFIARRTEGYYDTTDIFPFFTEPDQLTIRIPMESLDENFDGLATVRSLNAEKDRISLGLMVDQAFSTDILAQLQSEVAADSGEITRILEKHIDDAEILAQSTALLEALKEPVPEPATPVAYISYLENEVEVFDESGEYRGEIGMDLAEGTTLHTGQGSRAELILLNDSILRVGENTTFALKDIPGTAGDSLDTRLSLETGKLRMVVADLAGSGAVFDLETPSAVMSVRGTDFLGHFDEMAGLTVAVLEGRVAVATQTGKITVLNPDEKVEASVKELKKDAVLKAKPLGSREAEELRSQMPVISEPGDDEMMRHSARLWELIELAMKIAAAYGADNEKEAEAFLEELGTVVDLESIMNQYKQFMDIQEAF